MILKENEYNPASFKPRFDKPEYILCAAVYFDDGIIRVHRPRNIESGLVVTGFRHPDCFIILKEIYPDRKYLTNPDNPHVQGFLTSHKRFVNRHEAASIAHLANQITHYREGIELYSEDLY